MDYACRAYAECEKKLSLKDGMGPETLRLELARFWDSVMFSIMEATGEANTRRAYQMLIQQAKTQSEALRWLDEPEVFYSTAAADQGKRRMPWFGLASAALLVGLTVWFAFLKKDRSIPCAILIAGALALALVQFVILFSAVSAAPTVNVRTEQRISSEKVRSGLKRMARDMDGNADTLLAMLSESEQFSLDADMTLAQELLRLPGKLRSDAVTDAVDRFLVRSGVEKIEYSKEHQELFTVLPSDRVLTIEPALIKDGKVLTTGVACAPGEG